MQQIHENKSRTNLQLSNSNLLRCGVIQSNPVQKQITPVGEVQERRGDSHVRHRSGVVCGHLH